MLLCFTFTVSAQDIHYSQFFNSPLNISPGLTGVFNGNQRIHASYKSQWQQISPGFTTFSAGFDWKLLNQGKSNFLSVGALYNNDKAGDLNLTNNGINLFASYSMKMGAKSYLTPGIGVGFISRNVDFTNARTSSLILGQGQDVVVGGNDNVSYVDINAGLNYRYQKASRKFFDLGVSAYHITTPSEKFYANTVGDVKRPMRLNLYGMATWKLASKLDLLVNVLQSMQDPYSETILNAQGKLHLGNSSNTALYLGIGTRLGDAIWPMIAIEHNNIYASFNYDITTSEFNWATNGGPEFHIRYIISKVPNSLFKPCPIY